MAAEPKATVSRRYAPVTRLDARRTTRSREQLLRDLVPCPTASADTGAGSKMRIERLERRTPGKPACDEASDAAEEIAMDFGRGARAGSAAEATRDLSTETETESRRTEPYIGKCRPSAKSPFAGARPAAAPKSPLLEAPAPQQPAVQVGPDVQFIVDDGGGGTSAPHSGLPLRTLHIAEDGQVVAREDIAPCHCLHYVLEGLPGGANSAAAVA
jgi:hypothetical protein